MKDRYVAKGNGRPRKNIRKNIIKDFDINELEQCSGNISDDF